MNEINIIDALAQKDQERLKSYQELLDFYQGRQWPGRERWGEKRLTFNYARLFVDKITSYLMSGMSFTVEAVQDTPEARTQAEEAEKALRRVYEDCGLEQLDFETEIDCAVLGGACYKVTWEEGSSIVADSRFMNNDLRDRPSTLINPKSNFLNHNGQGRVRVTAPDIQGIYAWWTGDDTSRIWRVASKYQLSGEEVEHLYPSSLINQSLHSLVEVWTEQEFELYLDGTLIEKKENPYGFIPFIIFPNLREPKKFWGVSDLAQIIEPQRELNRAFSQVSHILELSGNPVAVLENVEESADITVKPGAVWNIPKDAQAYLLDLLQGGGLDLHIKYIEQLYRVIHDISEAPRAAFGGINRNLSGIAMQIELYPLMQKIIRKRAIRTSVYSQRNRMILQLLEKFSNYTLHNTQYLHMKVVWGPVLPQDRAQLVANERILVQDGIHSRRRAMDEIGVSDPEAEFKHWLEEQSQITKIQETITKKD